MRRLKKADYEVDFFFMVEPHLNRRFLIKAPRKIKSFVLRLVARTITPPDPSVRLTYDSQAPQLAG